jgi:DNA-binding NtrC family response regulator
MISTKTETFSKNEEIVLGGNETILVAEDDISVRTLTRTILESKGYTVLEANDGADAIKVFEYNKDRIDMVMLDVVMPNKNGQEANEAIQRIRPGVPVLFISGYTADIVFGKGIGGVEINFISKPLLPDELLRKVRSVIDKAKTTLY